MTKQAVSTGSPGLPDRLELLQTFVSIVEAGSLSGAAKALRTTQPTISRRLQQLERNYSVRLLHRSTHAMNLSEEGRRCYEQAKELLANWEAFEAGFQGGEAAASGHLRVTVPHAFGQQVLIGPLAEFLRRHPQVDVEWLLRDYVPDFVAEGIDCAILVGEVREPSLVALKVAEVPRIVVAAPSLLVAGRASLGTGKRRLRPEELGLLPWLSLKTYYTRQVQLRHRRSGKTVKLAFRPRFSSDNLYAVREAALKGLGAALVSAWVVAEDLREGRLVNLLPEHVAPALPVHVVYPQARHQSAKLRRFVETLRELVPAALGYLREESPGAQSRLAAEGG